MKLIHTAVLTILAASMPMTVTVVKADTVTLETYGGVYPGLGGGEFTAIGSQINLGNYAAAATYNGGQGLGFETFCIETGVEFSPGTQYYYTLGNIAQPIPAHGTGSAISLTTGAAWLYYEFGTGNLNTYASFNYTYGSTRQADDNLLQAAIWYLQGGQTYGSYPLGGTGNKYYDAAIAALGSSSANSAYTGTSVEILQMWVDLGDTVAAQNQLVLTGNGPPPIPSVPDGGMTVILLGGALAGLQTLRRKLFC
jgi:hypothetical protein